MTAPGRRFFLATGLLALFTSACRDDPTRPVEQGPVPGHLEAVLSTPTGTEGALVLTLTGPSLPVPAAVQAANQGLRLFARPSAGTLRVAIFGTIEDGALLRFPVPDVTAATRYAGVVTEVAAPDHTLRPEPDGYTITIQP